MTGKREIIRKCDEGEPTLLYLTMGAEAYTNLPWSFANSKILRGLAWAVSNSRSETQPRRL
jgi:hypothetical protein